MMRMIGVAVAVAALMTACGMGAEEQLNADGTVTSTVASSQNGLEQAPVPSSETIQRTVGSRGDTVGLPQDPVPWMEGRPGPRSVTAVLGTAGNTNPTLR